MEMLKIYIASKLATLTTFDVDVSLIIINQVVANSTGDVVVNFFHDENQYSYRFDNGHEDCGIASYGFQY